MNISLVPLVEPLRNSQLRTVCYSSVGLVNASSTGHQSQEIKEYVLVGNCRSQGTRCVQAPFREILDDLMLAEGEPKVVLLASGEICSWPLDVC